MKKNYFYQTGARGGAEILDGPRLGECEDISTPLGPCSIPTSNPLTVSKLKLFKGILREERDANDRRDFHNEIKAVGNVIR